MSNQGWICPKCAVVNAPWMPVCLCQDHTQGAERLYERIEKMSERGFKQWQKSQK